MTSTPTDIQETEWGTATVEFVDCNHIFFEYSSDVPGYGSGIIDMERLAFVTGLKCSDEIIHGNFTIVAPQQDNLIFGKGVWFGGGGLDFHVPTESGFEVGLLSPHSFEGENFEFNGQTYSSLGGVTAFEGTGVFDGDNLTLNFLDGTQMVGSPISSFQRSLTTSMMAGTYDIRDRDDVIVGSLTIQSDGTVSGSTNAGCELNGLMVVPDTNFNQTYLDTLASTCGFHGNVYGSGFYNHDDNTIYLNAHDDLTGYVWTLELESAG